VVANGIEQRRRAVPRARSAPKRGWVWRLSASLVAAAAAAAAIVIGDLVDRGRLAHLDVHAVHQWMPWLQPEPRTSTLHGFVVPETRRATWGTVVALSTYPASVGASAAIVLLVVVLLWARGRRRSSVVIFDLWIAANLIELVGKHLVTRAPIHQISWGHHGTLPALNNSLPSGHVIRALIVAAALAALGRAGRIAYLWALTVPVAVVVIGDHTPTDAAAGLAAGIALVAAYQAVAE
jgi:membrane-associated phospholipid phosphatase